MCTPNRPHVASTIKCAICSSVSRRPTSLQLVHAAHSLTGEFQSIYCMSAVAASQSFNACIARELHVLLRATSWLQAYSPPRALAR
eukprot:5497624-Prymnesium_polylepis.1